MWSSVKPLSAVVWNSICAQALAKPAGCHPPTGTHELPMKGGWRFGRDWRDGQNGHQQTVVSVRFRVGSVHRKLTP